MDSLMIFYEYRIYLIIYIELCLPVLALSEIFRGRDLMLWRKYDE